MTVQDSKLLGITYRYSLSSMAVIDVRSFCIIPMLSYNYLDYVRRLSAVPLQWEVQIEIPSAYIDNRIFLLSINATEALSYDGVAI